MGKSCRGTESSKYLIIRKITDEAELAFWDVIVKNNPHITTGDLDPDISCHLTDLMYTAVKRWIELNTPEITPEITSENDKFPGIF